MRPDWPRGEAIVLVTAQGKEEGSCQGGSPCEARDTEEEETQEGAEAAHDLDGVSEGLSDRGGC